MELIDIQVRMERAHLRDIPHHDLPSSYSMRTMSLEEAPLWTEIQREAERLFPVGDDLFLQEFGSDIPAIHERCFFLVAEDGLAVGTVSAWYTANYQEAGETWGQIHWVAIRPSHQGRGLGRAMLCYAMEKLAVWHEAAWLSTSTARLPALKLYLDVGFVPDLAPTDARAAWTMVYQHLSHPVLARILA